VATPRHARPRARCCCCRCRSAGLQKRQLLLLQLQVLCGGGPGPGRELTGAAAFLLRSSATRSSLITILLLQPVFFLRPWARRKLKTGTGTVVIGQRLSGDAWRRTKEHGGTRDSSTSFLDKLKLDSEGDCSFKPEISRGPRFLKISFLGVDFSKKLKSWSPW